MRKPKYHFLVLRAYGNGTSLVALPGQTFGNRKVPEGVLVKDRKGSTVIARARKGARDGDIFFTTSLRPLGDVLSADDIFPLRGHGRALFADAEDEYEKLFSNGDQS